MIGRPKAAILPIVSLDLWIEALSNSIIEVRRHFDALESKILQRFFKNHEKVKDAVLPLLIVKYNMPLLVIAAIIEIYGSLSALETRIRFLASTQPLFLWSELLMILSSMLIISFPLFNTLRYSAETNWRFNRFKWLSKWGPTTPSTRYRMPNSNLKYLLRLVLLMEIWYYFIRAS